MPSSAVGKYVWVGSRVIEHDCAGQHGNSMVVMMLCRASESSSVGGGAMTFVHLD